MRSFDLSFSLSMWVYKVVYLLANHLKITKESLHWGVQHWSHLISKTNLRLLLYLGRFFLLLMLSWQACKQLVLLPCFSDLFDIKTLR